MPKITEKDLEAVEILHNRGFTDEEIGEVVGRSKKSVGQIVFHHKDKMNLIDRVLAKRIRKAHEQDLAKKIAEIKKAQRKKNKAVSVTEPEPVKQTLWDRLIRFFG